MGQSQRMPMTPDEFLAWEAKQETRWEFDGVRPVAMNGVSVAHSIVQTNLTAAVATRLRGSRCRAFGPSLKVEIGRTYRYPDLLVSCSQEPSGAYIVTEPLVIFEILSQSTARTDKTVVMRADQNIAYGLPVRVMSLLRQAGAERVAIATGSD